MFFISRISFLPHYSITYDLCCMLYIPILNSLFHYHIAWAAIFAMGYQKSNTISTIGFNQYHGQTLYNVLYIINPFVTVHQNREVTLSLRTRLIWFRSPTFSPASAKSSRDMSRRSWMVVILCFLSFFTIDCDMAFSLNHTLSGVDACSSKIMDL